MNSILSIIAGTPLWVWLALIYLLIRGIIALKPRKISIYKIFILPTIFLYLALNGLFLTQNFVSFVSLVRCLSLFAGTFMGFVLTKNVVIRADRKNKLIKIPGSPFTLFLVLGIFCIKYYFGFKSATDPVFAQTMTFILSKTISTGLLSGTSIGRAARYFYTYKTERQTDLG
jgi:hypothetical protein